MLRVATWNLHGLPARLRRLTGWLDARRPDVLCLQETRVDDLTFPAAALAARGYHVAASGQRRRHGVAVLSRQPLTAVAPGLPGLGGEAEVDPQARLLAATTFGLRIMSVLVPHGERVGGDAYALKLAWLARLRAQVARDCLATDPLVVAGDFSIAASDADIAVPERWAGSTLAHPDVRAALAQLRRWGLVDAVAQVHPRGGLHSWWEARRRGFARGDGLRVDHILVTAVLASRLAGATVDRDQRRGRRPSEHAPVWIDLHDG